MSLWPDTDSHSIGILRVPFHKLYVTKLGLVQFLYRGCFFFFSPNGIVALPVENDKSIPQSPPKVNAAVTDFLTTLLGSS